MKKIMKAIGQVLFNIIHDGVIAIGIVSTAVWMFVSIVCVSTAVINYFERGEWFYRYLTNREMYREERMLYASTITWTLVVILIFVMAVRKELKKQPQTGS